jgi:hypothetical protein
MRKLLSVTLMTLSTLSQAALAQTGTGTGTAPFCLKKMTGELSCTYATMGECDQARPSMSSDQCMTRADAAGTTGLGDNPPRPRDSRDGQSPSPGP